MKKILAIGLVFLLSACTRYGDSCCGTPVQNTCCGQAQIVRQPVQHTVYRTVYEPRNYDREVCERKAYKTSDCVPDAYYEHPQKASRRPVIVYKQNTCAAQSSCSSGCGACQYPSPQPQKMNCECSLR